MAVSDKTRSGALAEVLASERKTVNEQLRVALPGIIQSSSSLSTLTQRPQLFSRRSATSSGIMMATKAQRIIRCWWMFLWSFLVAVVAR